MRAVELSRELEDQKFSLLCQTCRNGDINQCVQLIDYGLDVNKKDEFDNTPLSLASLCGHDKIVHMLLISGADIIRDQAHSQKCIDSALSDKIRKLLICSRKTPLSVPRERLMQHLPSTLNSRDSDIIVKNGATEIGLHKYMLHARSPYFALLLEKWPELSIWEPQALVPEQSLDICVRYVYLDPLLTGDSILGELPPAVLEGTVQIACEWELTELVAAVYCSRLEPFHFHSTGRLQLNQWFEYNIESRDTWESTPTWRKNDLRSSFADVILKARDKDCRGNTRYFPAHRGILSRCDVFRAMFRPPWTESRKDDNLQVVTIDCSPETLREILRSLYTETIYVPPGSEMDIISIADMLLMEDLKLQASLLFAARLSTSYRSHDELEAIVEKSEDVRNWYIIEAIKSLVADDGKAEEVRKKIKIAACPRR